MRGGRKGEGTAAQERRPYQFWRLSRSFNLSLTARSEIVALPWEELTREVWLL